VHPPEVDTGDVQAQLLGQWQHHGTSRAELGADRDHASAAQLVSVDRHDP